MNRRKLNPAFTKGSHCDTKILEENNYDKLPSYKDKTLTFTSVLGRKYKLPDDNEYLKNWNGIQSFVQNPYEVVYLRNTTELSQRGRLGNCASTLDVLAWLMDRINEKEYGSLMIVYRELMYLHREGDFVNKTTGKFIVDDIDAFTSLETAVYIGQLEKELFDKFGWSMRAFINNHDYLVFMQIMAVCGHFPRLATTKVESTHPGIEVYPLAIVDVDDKKLAKDLWQGTKFKQSMVYPPQCIFIDSAVTSSTLHLQIPHKSIPILECIYGDWTVPSSIHAGGSDCSNYKESETPPIASLKDVDIEQKALTCHVNEKAYDNTIKGDILEFTSKATNEEFYLPTDNTYLEGWTGIPSFKENPASKVTYLRNTTELSIRGKQGDCASTLDVLAWIMDKINEVNHVLMIAYGELIHVHREKDFVNSTGDYIDNDIDTWATLDTVVYIGGQLEEALFSKFGWSMRAFVNGDNYVVFMQIMATCGHHPIPEPAKVTSSQPAIELYPVPIVIKKQTSNDNEKTERIIKDLWQGTTFDDTLMYPPKCINFKSAGRENPISLQVPNQAVKMLDCLYGTWTIKSDKYARLTMECRDNTEII